MTTTSNLNSALSDDKTTQRVEAALRAHSYARGLAYDILPTAHRARMQRAMLAALEAADAFTAPVPAQAVGVREGYYREALEHIRTCRGRAAASGFPIGVEPDAAGYMERYAEAVLATTAPVEAGGGEALWEAVHSVVLEAWNLLDGTANSNPPEVDQQEWDALSAAMATLDALIPEAERPASPSYAVRLLRKLSARRTALAGSEALFDAMWADFMVANDPPPAGNKELFRGGWDAALAAPRTAPAGGVGGALADIAAERRRQIEAEGWTPEHDDLHAYGEMGHAAACYAAGGPVYVPDPNGSDQYVPLWPWSPDSLKLTDRRRNLVKAGALIGAEIERLDRGAFKEVPFAYCCNMAPATCDCVNPNHGTAWIPTLARHTDDNA